MEALLRGAPVSDGVCLRAAWAIWLTRLVNWSLRATKSVSLLTWSDTHSMFEPVHSLQMSQRCADIPQRQ